MLKKVRTSNQLLGQPSLKNLIEDSKNNTKTSELKQLFLPQKREIFELSYLYKSPHYNHEKSYNQLVCLLESYNNQTLQIQNSNSLIKQINSFNKIKLACMRLIYRQLLSIAVMQEWQIRKSDLPRKIKNCIIVFQRALISKKRKQSIIERQIEENVRSTYISNVFDEINDYMRKQIDYTSTTKKDSFMSLNKLQKQKKNGDNLNLPFIDLLLYKRQDARLRQNRQKQHQHYYFQTMLKNKNHMREKSLLKLNNIYNVKQNLKMEEVEKKSSSTYATQQHFYPAIKRESFIEKNPLKTRLEWFKSKENMNNRLSLSNINGINLINCKLQ